MTVFTEQPHDLRKCHGPRDRSRGTYAHIPRIAEAQAKLYDEILCTDQVIWCSVDELPHCALNEPRFIHTIDEDERDEVAILDGMIWEYIIGQKCIPQEARDSIRRATLHMDIAMRDRVRAEMEAQYLVDHLPSDLWGSLRTDDLNCRMPQILLSWPLQASRIVQVKKV